MISDRQSHSTSNDDLSVDREDEPLDGLTIFLFLGGGFGLLTMLATVAVSGLQLNAGDNARFALGTGQFGDSFGFVTSIFTGLAFLGLLISVRLQRKELRELKGERNETKKMLASQLSGADQAQASRESRDLLDQIFMIIDRTRERNRRSLEALDQEQVRFQKIYQSELGSMNVKRWQDFKLKKLKGLEAHARFPRLTSLQNLQNQLDQLLIELETISENTTDEELSKLYSKTWSGKPMSDDSGQPLVELALSLEDRLWNNLENDGELRLNYRIAIVQLLDEAIDDQFRCVFAISILRAAFEKRSNNKLLWNFVGVFGWHSLPSVVKEIELIMATRKVAQEGIRIVTVSP